MNNKRAQSSTTEGLKDNFVNTFKLYESYHTSLGCRITHMIGVPAIAISILMMLTKKRGGKKLFVGGWVLQFLGHFAFEHNKPFLFDHPGPLVPFVSMAFITRDWYRLLTGNLIQPELNHRKQQDDEAVLTAQNS